MGELSRVREHRSALLNAEVVTCPCPGPDVLRSTVGGDMQRYAQACVDARQLFLRSEESVADNTIVPYNLES